MHALMGTFLVQFLLLAPFLQGTGEELSPGYWERSPLPQMGTATYYARGMMEHVVEYRTRHGQLPHCDDCVGAVALLRAGDIGRKVWLQPPGGDLAGPFMVVDCARREDVPVLVDADWAVDVGYEVGQQWGMTGPMANVIVWPDPEDQGNPQQSVRPYIEPSDILITAPTPTGLAPRPALPTRLPAPRGTPVVMAPSGQTSGSGQGPAQAPSAPVVTTPTPYGGMSATPDPQTSAVDGTVSAGLDGQIALGRPGLELLLQAARPASFLQDPTAPPETGMPLPTVTPPAPRALETRSTLTLPHVTRVPDAQELAPGRSALQEWWQVLRNLLLRKVRL